MTINWRRFLGILALTSVLGFAEGDYVLGGWAAGLKEAIWPGLGWAVIVYWIYGLMARELTRSKYASKHRGH